jgi:alpha-L-fucosidase
MTMGTQWGYIRNDDYKTSAHLIDILTTVVSTGGNLLLDIGPGPDGKLPENALSRLRDIASWMKINGESIHDTEPLFPYTQWMETMDASTVLKLTRKDRVIYLTTMLSNGDVDVPDTTYVTFAYQNSFGDLDNYTVGHIELLGSTVPVKFDFVNDFLHIYVPSGTASPSSYAYVFKITE